MIRGVLLAGSLGLLTAIGIPNLGAAQQPESEPSNRRSQPEAPEQPEGREQWREQLLTANQALAIAQKRAAVALRTYESMRHRRRPRGEAKQAIMDELRLSR